MLKQFTLVALLVLALSLSAFAQVVPSSSLIQYTSDFTSVTYLDASGAKVTVSFTDGQRFSDLVTIRNEQLQAVVENKTAAANYTQTIQNDQVSVNAGRPVPPVPVIPQQKVVSNAGVVTYQDFNPSLPVLVPVVTSPSTVHGLINTSLPTTPDPAAQQSAMLTVILQQLSAVIAALTAKGII
jgi:hypothetical protein